MNTLATPPRSSPPLAGLTAALCLIAVLYVAFAYFAAPLPGTTSVHYGPDTPWQLSLAADAKYHWPIQDPNVAGEPLPYHFFVHVHMAAASNVTGVDLTVVFLRLFIVPLIALSVLLFVVAGRSLRRSAVNAVAMAGLLLVIWVAVYVSQYSGHSSGLVPTRMIVSVPFTSFTSSTNLTYRVRGPPQRASVHVVHTRGTTSHRGVMQPRDPRPAKRDG